MTRQTMGERLIGLRNSAGLSQRQLARATGVPVTSIRNWEHNRRFPGLISGARLAKALGVSMEDLVANLIEAEEPEPAKKPRRSRKQSP